MASKVNVCNMALIKCGGKTITSLTDGSTEAKVCSELYDTVRDAVSREHPHNCVIKREAIAKDANAPAFGYANQFVLPADCLRVLTLNEVSISAVINGFLVYDTSEIKFKIEGRRLLTDESTANIVFVFRNDDPNSYDPLFLDMFSQRLAAEISWPVSKNPKLFSTMWEIYRDKMRTSRNVDGMEGTPDAFISDELGSVRH
jgi:hypothetical protein